MRRRVAWASVITVGLVVVALALVLVSTLADITRDQSLDLLRISQTFSLSAIAIALLSLRE